MRALSIWSIQKALELSRLEANTNNYINITVDDP
jgi:hypothetical protein